MLPVPFVAMLFIAAALTGGWVNALDSGQDVSDDAILLADATTAVLVGTLGINMAAIFTLVVSTLGRRTGLVPRWLGAWGYATGLLLLLSPGRFGWVAMLFPAWVRLWFAHPGGVIPTESWRLWSVTLTRNLVSQNYSKSLARISESTLGRRDCPSGKPCAARPIRCSPGASERTSTKWAMGHPAAQRG